jgi:thiamine-monophosphate kinase
MDLRALGEFGAIRRIRRAAERSPRSPALVLGIGDDAALLRGRAGEEIVLTTDALVEDVHFRWRSDSPRSIGRRALAVNLSDLAAMGARPVACELALVAPPGLAVRVLDGLVAGLLEEARRYRCPLVGGNISRGRETSLTVVALGAVARGRALRRDRARAGDRVLVTGTLGGAALERTRAERRGGRARRVPTPRLRAGQALAAVPGVGACIDVSDGFDADLGHLLEGRPLAAEIDGRRLPLPPGFRAGCARLGLDPLRLAREGGEDYELLFTLRPGAPSAARLARRLAVRVTEVGRLRRAGPVAAQREPPRGWRHF